jgi:hypothetical protein
MDCSHVDSERMARFVDSDLATPGQPEAGEPSPPLLGNVLGELTPFACRSTIVASRSSLVNTDDVAANDHVPTIRGGKTQAAKRATRGGSGRGGASLIPAVSTPVGAAPAVT